MSETARSEQVSASRKRRYGILCHPTSFPGPFGIGDLGASAYRFVDTLAEAGCSVWQILPLGPTGYGDSPYQPFSAFAGNPLLIDPRQLVDQGLLDAGRLDEIGPRDDGRVSYGDVIQLKGALLGEAYRNLGRASDGLGERLAQYRDTHRAWLEDYALFMALKEHLGWLAWPEWEPGLLHREPEALNRWREQLAERVGYHCLIQFLFEEQWQHLHRYATAAGISIIGDLPIFVGHDSCDVWAHQDLYSLDDRGKPTVVAGVPPDYFSPTGQRWGNPLYDWPRMAQNGYRWWVQRLQRTLAMVDEVRIDHFRGFVNYWEVPAEEPTAIKGRWVPGPGRAFFDAIAGQLGELPILVEDLGMITEDVTRLRDELGLPGMTVLQFAFDGKTTNPHLPFNHARHSIVYTATHDNDTTVGWYQALGERDAHRVRVYTGSDGSDMAWHLIRLALTSVAELAIVPLQDVLSLGSWARMNSPGEAQANWAWRYRESNLSEALAVGLADLARITGRHARGAPEDAPEPLTSID